MASQARHELVAPYDTFASRTVVPVEGRGRSSQRVRVRSKNITPTHLRACCGWSATQLRSASPAITSRLAGDFSGMMRGTPDEETGGKSVLARAGAGGSVGLCQAGAAGRPAAQLHLH